MSGAPLTLPTRCREPPLPPPLPPPFPAAAEGGAGASPAPALALAAAAAAQKEPRAAREGGTGGGATVGGFSGISWLTSMSLALRQSRL